MRRVPFWAQALAVCALFAVVGVVVLDDYGTTVDESAQRRISTANADYISTGNTDELYIYDFPYYGVAFEMPLLLAERALGLQDSRHIHLTRHLLTHLLFIAGGFACGMLAYRMVGSRWIALFAMLMFLLHPRLYAHSFFNTKDIPFAAMLAVALYLAHRAFRKDTGGAFLLCGIGVGLAIDLRPFGLMLIPMILAMRGLDMWQAGRAERKRILASGGIFAAAALATVYIVHPYYWENPLRFIEGLRVLSQHPHIIKNLFMGEIYPSYAVPWNYIPVWFAITAPPVALALGAVGCAAVCWRAIAHPVRALRARETRFGVLLLGCVALPVAVAIILQSNIYHGWRHMYFLWAPLCLLAAMGLHSITNISMGGGIWKIGARLPGWVRGGGNRLHTARRALTHGAVGFGLLTTLTAMTALHPYEHLYFNALVDTKTPGAPGNRYEMDYWELTDRQSLEYLLARYPNDTLRVWPGRHWFPPILPQEDRDRLITFGNPRAADFYLLNDMRADLRLGKPVHVASHYLHPRIDLMDIPDQPPIHSIRAYGSVVSYIVAKDVEAYLAAYDDVAANGTPLARSNFDIYAYDGALYYLSADCPPPAPNAADWVFLNFFPVDPANLPAGSHERGFENRAFRFNDRAAFFDGKCMGRRPLPDYAVERIETGAHMNGELIWRTDISLAAQALYESIAAGDYGKPVAQSGFDLYLSGNRLAYLKEPCAAGDADAWTFLHIIPANPADLPADRREYGFANLDFRFADRGADIVGKCVAARDLPDYPIARIRTGQKATALGGDGWRADIDLVALDAAQAVYDSIAAGEYGQRVAQSEFDVYMRGGGLAYIKEPCDEGDADARFFLHIVPANPADLPADRRERGFDNRDFRFAERGARVSDMCVATIDLPDYAIERIRTGQFVSGEGSLWRVEFPAAR